ncbi:MAG: thiamine phosphate synthase [Pyrinomonadaceae bacterium]
MSSVFLDAFTRTRLYPVTDREVSRLSHAEQVSELTQNGVSLVQLREKILSPREFYKEAEAALQIARERRVKIIINDRVDIALALSADGVHLGQEDLPPKAARRLLGSDAIIGFSTHNPEQARLAAKLPIDYIAIGSIFTTRTKRTPYPPLGLEGLRLIRQAIGKIPLIAIGGITTKNSHDVLDAGADAVAVISDLWASPGQLSTQISRLRTYL